MLDRKTYLLVCLIEECSEVIQRVCKSIRFGMEECQPGQDKNNFHRLWDECQDVFGVCKKLADDENVPIWPASVISMKIKNDRIERYMELSRKQKMLKPDKKI